MFEDANGDVESVEFLYHGTDKHWRKSINQKGLIAGGLRHGAGRNHIFLAFRTDALDKNFKA
jgi:hypothetical protein